MSKLAFCLVAAAAVHVCAAGTAPAAMIAFRPALIPGGQPPLPVPLAIDPAKPTTTDVIAFTAPLDGKDHSNKWYAAKALLGSPVLAIDEANHTIHIHFDGIYSDIHPEIYAPVVGAYGACDLIRYTSRGGFPGRTAVT